MQETKVPNRYAKALLEFSIEKNSEDLVYQQIKELFQALKQEIEFSRLLMSPIVKTSVKMEALVKIYPDKNSVMRQFVDMLSQNKRLSLLLAICKSYIALYYEYKNRKIAVVTTALPLQDSLKDKILTKVKNLTNNQNVILENRVEPSIIGGFILRVGDLQYNASVQSKLISLERNFKENLYTNI